MKILMVLTSHDQLGDTGKKTGFWLEEFAAPYYIFKDAVPKSPWCRLQVDNRRWTPRVMSKTHRPPKPSVSVKTLLPSRRSPIRVAWLT